MDKPCRRKDYPVEVYMLYRTFHSNLIYRADKIYPILTDDKTTRLVSSNMRLVRTNDTYQSIDSLADEVFDASADRVENHNNCL